MLKTPEVLGFSMVHRNHRRWLVVVTYVTFLALMAALTIILPPMRGQSGTVMMMCLILAYNVVSRGVFGGLVKDTVLPEVRGGEMTSLGLTPARRRGEDEPDERDVAVRNAAYFQAYRAVAVYSMVVWVASAMVYEVSASTALRLIQLVTMPLVAMALTLPQAVILWTEPDVPEEARV
jgi:hypothetical protein